MIIIVLKFGIHAGIKGLGEKKIFLPSVLPPMFLQPVEFIIVRY